MLAIYALPPIGTKNCQCTTIFQGFEAGILVYFETLMLRGFEARDFGYFEALRPGILVYFETSRQGILGHFEVSRIKNRQCTCTGGTA